MRNQEIPASHMLIALLVVAIWGTNFVIMHEGLERFPPLTFAALRFTLAFVPMAFFVPRPKMPWKALAAYGVLIGVGQFGTLFYAMNGHISAGLASLLVQTQAFFTVALSTALTRERVSLVGVVALALCELLPVSWTPS